MLKREYLALNPETKYAESSLALLLFYKTLFWNDVQQCWLTLN